MPTWSPKVCRIEALGLCFQFVWPFVYILLESRQLFSECVVGVPCLGFPWKSLSAAGDRPGPNFSKAPGRNHMSSRPSTPPTTL